VQEYNGNFMLVNLTICLEIQTTKAQEK
jgi:hypothetical protein